MLLKRIIYSLGIVVLFVIAIAGFAHDTPYALAQLGTDKIEPSLQDQFSAQRSSDFIVRFTEQADLSAAYGMDWEARGEFVYNTLRETAERSQVNAKALLDVQGLKHQTFIAGNDLYVWSGSQTDATELSSLPEVDSIRLPRTYTIDPAEPARSLLSITWAGDLLAQNAQATVGNSTTAVTDWGITDTKADQFWTAFGAQGNGIVVASIDTGVQWNHPALDQAYKCGGDPTNPACWYDPTLICGAAGACDNIGHGTHTVGTMVADNDPSLSYIAGMAPDAKWIACKGCLDTHCYDPDLNACADWILAPDGDPANRPNIVNNSWGGVGDNPWYQAKVNAWRAAGIFPAFSSGNNTGCDSMGSPGDYQESFASTAHDISRNHAYSQGSSAFGDTPYTKPNITAPGVQICSSVPPNNWNCGYSGTSMASPHTAGAVALLWSCNPSLKGQVDATFNLLQNNADPPDPPNPACGVPPDGQGTYEDGYGYLDVLAAGEAGCAAPQDVWTQIALPPGCPDWTRFDGEYFAPKNKVYFMGGRSGATIEATPGDIYSFDPSANTCADTGANMPIPISNYTIVQLTKDAKQLLCTFGGRNSAGGTILDVQCYDPNLNSMTTGSTLPASFSGFVPGGVAVVNNKVYVFGGFSNTIAPYNIADTWEWNPGTDGWTKKGDLSLARGYMDVAVVDGKIYAFGGDTFDGALLVAQTKAEVFNPATGLWDDLAVPDLPVASGEGTAYGYNSDGIYELRGKIVIAGGGQWPYQTNEAFVYNVKYRTYDYGFANLNVTRRNQAGFFVPGNPGKMWVFGGRWMESDEPPYAPPEYYVVDYYPYPQAAITPPSLNATLLPDKLNTVNFTIGNPGTAGLNWLLTESSLAVNEDNSSPFIPIDITGGGTTVQLTTHSAEEAMGIVEAPEVINPQVVLYDQPLDSIVHTAYIDQEFPDMQGYSSFLGDDFATPVPWAISSIFIPGNLWSGGTTLLNATSLTWQLYFDATGFPDGDPAGGGLIPIWNLRLPPNDSRVTITNGSGGLPSNTLLSLPSPLLIAPGKYWLVFYPTMNYGSTGQYGRQPSGTTNGKIAKFINPGGALGFGTAWQDWSVLDATKQDIAFRLEGAQVAGISWLSEGTLRGSVTAAGSQQVAVKFDATGMAIGVYNAELLVRSNDQDQPLISLPVRMTVISGDVFMPLVLKH